MMTPLTIIVFGATGDLFQKKLVFALHGLFHKKLLPLDFSVIGYGRRDMSDEDFRLFVKNSLEQKLDNEHTYKEFLPHFKYIKGELDNRDDVARVSEADLFYLALPPRLSEVILRTLHESGRVKSDARILIEKPFGEDGEHAHKLDEYIKNSFKESQIFHIDHYLAKETVENILKFRKERILEDTWNSGHIEKVKIWIHETNTLKNRGVFYDALGALKDVGQNHMLEMLAFVAMDIAGADSVQSARADIFTKVKVLKENIVRAQYEGYKNEAGVAPRSETETFFRINLEIDTDIWRGVVFELESGKALAQSGIGVEIFFKDGKTKKFDISAPSKMDAYEKILLAGIARDQKYFASSDEIMAMWRIVGDIINSWQSVPLLSYIQGADAKDIQ